MVCPKCGGEHVTTQVMQEQTGSKTTTKTKSKYKEKGHGCLWWLFIGWWWWFFDLILWSVAFIPRLIIKLNQKKKYAGESTSTSTTKNKYGYRTICVCQDCGYRWEA